MNRVVDNLLDDGFWVDHIGKTVYLNIETAGGHFCSRAIAEADWIDWLRAELEQCETTKIPVSYKELLGGG